MESVTLHTDLPELFNDLSDVIRLFLGECEISEEPGGSLAVVHTMGQQHVVTVGVARAVAAAREGRKPAGRMQGATSGHLFSPIG